LPSSRQGLIVKVVLRRFLITWAFNFVALWVAALLLSGIDYDGIGVLIVAALVFSIVNIFVRPVLILFTLPLVLLTLGLALFFINLFMLYLTSWIVDDFTIDGFWWAFLATIIVWLVNTVLEAFFGDDLRDPGPRRPDVVDSGY
jgi:putative membrane protein